MASGARRREETDVDTFSIICQVLRSGNTERENENKNKKLTSGAFDRQNRDGCLPQMNFFQSGRKYCD
jgi:hypothetical protein